MPTPFPHPPYAEDQPLAHLILTTHVLHRGFQLGAGIGYLAGITRSFLKPACSSSPPPPPPPPLLPLPPTAIGAVVGMSLSGLALPVAMWGKTLVEWQDRSWRLLESEGQGLVDSWSLGGMVLGVAVGVWGLGIGKVVVRGLSVLVGGAGIGCLGGLVGLVAWRGVYRL
ncbi:hypothetical protein BO71DRAFT_381591 [Aspergillus ellipticus CBS 707.79]|uniref:Uncharacterized protein n=1 Tax=Aspergillus ellipticus CBS 707.79 TaxID=1448320 RepID=A0A319D7K1_9EURO|nr:hypothetical protein BO71DRAFT_381591 [Aspergillus ellipticus CBS 707.79]